MNLGIYIVIKSDLAVEKRLYKKMNKDLEDLVETIQASQKEKER